MGAETVEAQAEGQLGVQPWTISTSSLEEKQRCAILDMSETEDEIVLRYRGQELGYRPGSEVRRWEVVLWGQGALMGGLLGVQGQGLWGLFYGIRGQDWGAALSLNHSPGP